MAGLLAALGAAMVWTTASSLWRSVSSSGSALQLNTVKNGLATLLFLPVLLSLPWGDNGQGVALLLLSGVIGIAIGNTTRSFFPTFATQHVPLLRCVTSTSH